MVGDQKWEVPDSTKTYAQGEARPTISSGLLESRDSLVSQWHISSYSRSHTLDLTREKDLDAPQAGLWQTKAGSILARWSSAYDAYLDVRGDNLTGVKRKGTAVLRILKELGSTAMTLTKTTVEDQMDWDVLCPMFQKIVSLAEDIIALDKNSASGIPTYCMDMALVGPLFEVSLLFK
jgi:hypothetical protein